MLNYIIRQQLNIMLFFLAVFINSIINLFRIKNLKSIKEITENLPYISILIPARNEEKNIERCVRSVLNQNLKNFELIVLNDNSEDNTLEILEKIQKEDIRLKIIDNKILKEGWLGKPNACQILYENSKGDILVFLDADTFHKENSISKAVSFLIKNNLDYISVFPQEIVSSTFEKIIIPFMNFALMSFYPLIPFANGQFVIYKREVLDKIGGFEKIKDEVLDDIKMANILRILKFKTRILSGKNLSFCRMYYDVKSVFMGFIKSYFAIFDYHLLLSIFVFTYLVFAFFYPYILLYLKIKYHINEIRYLNIISIYLFSYLIFLLTYYKFGYPLIYSILFQITILINSLIGYLSIIYTIAGKRIWKGRTIPKKRFKII